MDKEKPQSVLVAGIYRNQGKYGEYFSGSLGFSKIVITENKNKKHDKSPDYWLKIVEKPKEQKQQSAPSQQDEWDYGV